MNEQPQDQVQMFDYKSRWPVKSAGYFTRTCCLLSLEISPVYYRVFMCCHWKKSQTLMMSVFCSNSLIFAPECWKCILTIFHKLALASCTFAASFVLLHPLRDPKLHLKSYRKPWSWFAGGNDVTWNSKCSNIRPLFV